MAVVYADNIMLRSDSMALDARMSFEYISDLANTDDNYYPAIYLGFCYEDEKIYLYKKSNSVDPTTGKWREFSVDLSAYALDADLQSHVTDTDIHVTVTDKTAWNALEPRITTDEGLINTNATNIAQLLSDVNTLLTDMSQAQTDISTNSSDIAQLQTDVSTNASAITVLNGGATDVGSVLYTVLQQIGLAQHLSKEIVTTLPAVANAKDNTIYLIQNGTDYDQYLLINGAFASLGSTNVNISYDDITDLEWTQIMA